MGGFALLPWWMRSHIMLLPHRHHVMTSIQIGRVSAARLRFKLYPNGEFSATRVREVATLVSDADPAAFHEDMRWTEKSYAKGQVSDNLRERIIRSVLGSSNVPNSHKTPKVRGRRGMTRYNKRLIVNSVLLLERKYGKKHLSFLTLTLPPQCASRSADLYAECKRQFAQWLQRTLARYGLPLEVIGCTEIQTGRLADQDQFALHEHWVFVGRHPYKSWSLSPKKLTEAWSRILGNVYKLGTAAPSFNASVRVESIKKSAAAYLGKYISKGEKCVQSMIDGGFEEFLPSSWVTKSLSMLKMFKRAIFNIEGDVARVLMETLQDNSSILTRWSKNLSIPYGDGLMVWIGFIGYFNIEGWRMFEMIQC